MKKVSIIIPVYNVEKYLEKCLISARNQTLKDIEIICINDGSTDRSLSILLENAKEDERIRIINKANSGYGATMNLGIEQATGKYIVFLESDDYVLPDMCETLYELCEKNQLDIVKTDFYEFKMKGDIVCSRYRKVSDYNNYHKVLNPKESEEVFFASMYTWTCMYSRSFLNRYHIRHHETPGASYQDNGFWFQTLMHCEKMYLFDKAYYMYRQDNPDASVHDKNKVRAFSEEYAFIRKKIEDYGHDKRKLLKICAFFDLHHNMMSLKRVDKQYTEELIQMIQNNFQLYRDEEAWNFRELSSEFKEHLLKCLGEPLQMKNSVWRYQDESLERLQLLSQYEQYILYGAGKYAKRVLNLFEECKLWNKDVVCGITDPDKADKQIEGIPIQNIEQLILEKKNSLVILCAKKDTEHFIQMDNNLIKWGITEKVYADDLFIRDMWDCEE